MTAVKAPADAVCCHLNYLETIKRLPIACPRPVPVQDTVQRMSLQVRQTRALVLAARACVCWDCHAMVTLDVAGSTSVQAIHDLHLLDRHDTQATLSSEQLPLCNAVKWCEESQRAQAICVITSDGIELKEVLRVRHKLPSTMWLVRCRRHACCCVSGEHSNAGLSKLQTSHCYHQQHAVC